MNYLRKLKRLFVPQEKNYKCASTTVLYNTARIINNLANTSAIDIGEYTHVRGELLTFGHGGQITIGEYCYIGEQSYIWSARNIFMGNRVLIAHNVSIFDNITHPLSALARHEQFKCIISYGQPKNIDLSEQPIIIEDDVWVGCMSVILRGVHIGRGAVVAAGSVVTKSVAAWTVVAGNPARVVKEIPEDQR